MNEGVAGNLHLLSRNPIMSLYWAEHAACFAPLYYIGGNSDHRYGIEGPSGRVVKSLKFCHNNDALNGFRLQFRDSTTYEIGNTHDNCADFTFDDGERINQAWLYGNGRGEHNKKIKFTTNKSKKFEWGDDPGSGSTYPVPRDCLGSGLLAGFSGRWKEGNLINIMSFVFYKEIESVTRKELAYSNWPVGQSSTISQVSLEQSDYYGPYSWEFTDSKRVTIENTRSSSTATQVGLSVTTEATVFDIVKIGATASWSTTWTQGVSQSASEEVSLTWSVHDFLPAGKALHLEATSMKGTMDLSTASIIIMKGVDGCRMSYFEEGTSRNVGYTKVAIKQTDIPFRQST